VINLPDVVFNPPSIAIKLNTGKALIELVPGAVSPSNPKNDYDILYRKYGTTKWLVYSAPFLVYENCTIQVQATGTVYDNSGKGTYMTSDVVQKDITGIATTAVPIPVITYAQSLYQEVVLKWSAISNILGYAIYEIESDKTTLVQIESSGTTTARITVVYVPGKSHTYFIQAIDRNGYLSRPSESATVTIAELPKPTISVALASPVKYSLTIVYPGTLAKNKFIAINDVECNIADYAQAQSSYLNNDLYTVDITENGTINAYYTDNYGKQSPISTYVVTSIEHSAPSAPVIKYEYETITISYPSIAESKEYSVDSEAIWQAYTGPFKVTQNCVIRARCRNAAGVASAITSYTINSIIPAGTAIVFSKNPSLPTSQPVLLNISYPTSAVKKQYKITSTGAWTEYNSQLVITSNADIYARFLDQFNCWSSEVVTSIANINIGTPTGSNLPYIKANVLTSTNENVVITIIFTSDSIKKLYRINDGEWIDYVKELSIPENCTISAKSSDTLGNWSSEAFYTIFNIDKEPPEAPIFICQPEAPTNKDVALYITYSPTAIFRGYRIGEVGDFIDYLAPITIQEKCRVYAKCVDEAGNSSEAYYDITNIDKLPPGNPSIAYSESVNGYVTVTIKYGNDATIKQYSLNNQEYTVYTGPFKINKNSTIVARAQDVAGNWTQEVSAQVASVVPVVANIKPINDTYEVAEGLETTLEFLVDYTDGNTAMVTNTSFSFRPSDITRVLITSSGVLKGIKSGQVVIYATYDNKTIAVPVVILPATPVGLAVTPKSVTLRLYDTAKCKCTLVMSDKTTKDVTNQVRWEITDNPSSLLIDNGYMQANGTGNLIATAYFGIFSDYISLAIEKPVEFRKKLVAPTCLELSKEKESIAKIFNYLEYVGIIIDEYNTGTADKVNVNVTEMQAYIAECRRLCEVFSAGSIACIDILMELRKAQFALQNIWYLSTFGNKFIGIPSSVEEGDI
jgi:hypothetical protein